MLPLKYMNHNHHNNSESDKGLYQCSECGLHYEDKERAEECEVWCKAHHSCNLEITNHAIENKQ